MSEAQKPNFVNLIDIDSAALNIEDAADQIITLKFAAKAEGLREPELVWVPNCFRLTPNLPQILKKSGMKAIVTGSAIQIENSPGTLNYLLWQGIDGTQIPIFFPEKSLKSIESSSQDFEGDVRKEMDALSVTIPVWVSETPFITNESQTSQQSPNTQRGNYHKENKFYNTLVLIGKDTLPDVSAAISSSVLEATDADWKNLLDSRLQTFALSINTRGVKRPVIVMNCHSFFANEAVVIGIKGDESPVAALGPQGELQPVQIVVDADGGRSALFVAKNVPMHGYAVWDLMATSIAPDLEDPVFTTKSSLENELLRVEFDYVTGLITSIFDKSLEREVLNAAVEVSANGKRKIVLENTANQFEAVDRHHLKTTILELENIELLEDGPVRGALRFTRKFGNSRIVQTIRLTSASPRLDFLTEIDWKEKGHRLDVVFPLAINARRAAFEIPYGYSERPTFRNPGCSYFDDFIRCGWIDLSEGDYGAALLNDSKLSMKADGNSVRLTLNKPNESECSWHRFSYALLPHDGDLREGEILENTYSLKNPPRALAITGNQTGLMPLQQTFFELDNAGVFIESIHLAKADMALIVRLYEGHNTRGTVALSTIIPIKKAFLTDLLERELVEIPIFDGGILLPVLPFEIITVKFLL